MAKNQFYLIKDTVLKLQLALLDGIQNENQLFAAGSLMSRSDYEDVVTERSIAKLCGYPLCHSNLSPDNSRKGRFRISLKEHKVYDLQETYKYCSSTCLINSRAFSGKLQDERCSVMNPVKIKEILALFENRSMNSEGIMGNNSDLGLSGLKIQEKTENNVGEVPIEEWMGPSNAIEGYVPHGDRKTKTLPRKNAKESENGSKAKIKPLGGANEFFSNLSFTTIITDEEYSVSKITSGLKDMTFDAKSKGQTGEFCGKESSEQFTILETPCAPAPSKKSVGRKARGSKEKTEVSVTEESTYNLSDAPSTSNQCNANGSLRTKFCGKESNEQYTILETPRAPAPSKKSVGRKARGSKEKTEVSATKESTNNLSDAPSTSNQCNANGSLRTEKLKCGSNDPSGTQIKPSLKQPGKKNLHRSVTWADEITDDTSIGNLPEVGEMGKTLECSRITSNLATVNKNNEDVLRIESAEACAIALSQAAEAITSGPNEISDAVSEAGITILPRPNDANEEAPVTAGDGDNKSKPHSTSEKPNKPELFSSDLFDPNDSWYDAPPEGFSLALSSFATMWMAIFAWITSSSLAYVYGKDDKFHEEFMYIDGREYPRKVVSVDGRSSEIMQTLAGCLTRSIPGLASELKLSTPISSLEHGMAQLLDTMTFVDALPAFRMKQWQVIVLLFIEALSVNRIPSLASHMKNSTSLIHKVIDRAQIQLDEYKIMRDHILPLGRAAQFPAENGCSKDYN